MLAWSSRRCEGSVLRADWRRVLAPVLRQLARRVGQSVLSAVRSPAAGPQDRSSNPNALTGELPTREQRAAQSCGTTSANGPQRALRDGSRSVATRLLRPSLCGSAFAASPRLQSEDPDCEVRADARLARMLGIHQARRTLRDQRAAGRGTSRAAQLPPPPQRKQRVQSCQTYSHQVKCVNI